MKNFYSLILVFTMMIAVFFGNMSKQPSDKVSNDGLTDASVLTDSQRELLESIFESETEWLASLQLSNGAIPMTAKYNGEVSVNPYFADFAALALLDNPAKYSDEVIKYMDWHFSHLNTVETDYNKVDGTIYDYSVTLQDGIIVKEEITVKDGKNSYDSTDSYAATFLTVLDKYYEKTGDAEYIILHKNDINRITEALFNTMHWGLTFAKPDYEIKYLMDNCEVYEGLLSAINLFEIICENDSAYTLSLQKCKYASEWIYNTAEKKLWNKNENYYEPAVDKAGNPVFEFSWNEYYPSAVSQLFPVNSGLIPADCERAKLLYDEFCSNYKWENFDIPDSFYWGSNVYAAVMMNDIDRAITYMTNYLSLTAEHAYPLYNADAAKVSMAAYLLISQ